MKNIVRELRAERGWTQGELAIHLGVSRQTVNAVETERYEPSLSLAFAIADLFKRPIEAIFRTRVGQSPPQSIDKGSLPD